MATGKPCKNTLYCGFSCPYLKNELGDLNFLLLQSDKQAKMKLSAKFTKNPVERIQSYLKFAITKVALNPLHIIFLNVAESLILAC